MTDNGCPKCNNFKSNINELCLDHQLEQAEATALQAMNRVEEIKQKIKQEQELKGTRNEKL